MAKRSRAPGGSEGSSRCLGRVHKLLGEVKADRQGRPTPGLCFACARECLALLKAQKKRTRWHARGASSQTDARATWTQEERESHITALEMRAVTQAVACLAPRLRGQMVCVLPSVINSTEAAVSLP